MSTGWEGRGRGVRMQREGALKCVSGVGWGDGTSHGCNMLRQRMCAYGAGGRYSQSRKRTARG